MGIYFNFARIQMSTNGSTCQSCRNVLMLSVKERRLVFHKDML